MAANAFDDRIRFGSLYEIYGALLTEKQRQCLELYFCEDYSLAEVAEEMQVSRQAIHDLLRRVEQTLEHYETMLGFLQRMENTRRLTEEAAAILDSEAKKRKDTGEILSCEYQSPAHPGTTVYVKDDFYGTSIWSGEYVYLVKYQSARGDGLPHETGPVEFDLILWNKAIETTLLAHCDMQNHSTVFYDKINELHNAILEANSHTHIPDEARFVIEKFVKGDLPF